MLKNKFRFFVPIDLEKGKNKKGDDVFKIKGRASTGSKDTQGETLTAAGFDLTNFRTINWNHKSQNDAAAYIGEPTKAVITKNGELEIEGELYGEMPMTHHVVSLMKALKKRGKTLGLSIEGKVLQRNIFDESKIERAALTGVAITPNPINGDTYAELIDKGFKTDILDWNYEDEVETLMKAVDDGTIEDEEDDDVDLKTGKKKKKAMTVAAIAPMVPESVEHNEAEKKHTEKEALSLINKLSLSKSSVYEQIYSYFCFHNTEPDVEKANSFYQLIKNISLMADKKEITQADITKAQEILNLASKTGEDIIQKAELTLEKAEALCKAMHEKKKTKKEIEEELEKAGYQKEIITKALSCIADANEHKDGGDITVIKKSIDELTAIYSDNQKTTDQKFGAIGDLFSALQDVIKSQGDQIVNLNTALDKKIDAMTEVINESQKDIKAMSGTTIRKSSAITEDFKNRFKIEEGKQVVNLKVKADREIVKAALLDIHSVSKNETLIKAVSDLEIGFPVSQAIADMLKEKKNLQIITQ